MIQVIRGGRISAFSRPWSNVTARRFCVKSISSQSSLGEFSVNKKKVFYSSIIFKKVASANQVFQARLTPKPLSPITPVFANFSTRGFHTSHPTRVPLIPLPAFLIGIGKSGITLNIVSWISRISLTILPHSLIKRNYRYTIILLSIPIIGIFFVLIVGADLAPNTGRLRLMFLTPEEELEICSSGVKMALESKFGLVLSPNHEWSLYVQQIADNLARVAVDPIDAPVRVYSQKSPTGDEPPNVTVHIVADDSTLNAVSYGSSYQILMYSLMLKFAEYNEDMIAAIMAHEIAHCLQRHFVEQHAFSSFIMMLWDFSRGILWPVLGIVGPYMNEAVNDWIRQLGWAYMNNTYNRTCEREADIVGLKILAKAGYNPEAAYQIWTKMAELELSAHGDGQVAVETVRADPVEGNALVSHSNYIKAEDDHIEGNIPALLTVWFGESHPPSKERIAYLSEHMEEAIAICNEARRLNGMPKNRYMVSPEVVQEEERGVKNTTWRWTRWLLTGR